MLGESEFFLLLLPAFGVFAEDVHLDVEGGAGCEGVEAGGSVGVGDDRYLYFVTNDGGNSQADAFDGDGTLRDDVTGEGARDLNAKAPVRGIGCGWRDGCEGNESAGAVYVALDYVATEG